MRNLSLLTINCVFDVFGFQWFSSGYVVDLMMVHAEVLLMVICKQVAMIVLLQVAYFYGQDKICY